MAAIAGEEIGSGVIFAICQRECQKSGLTPMSARGPPVTVVKIDPCQRAPVDAEAVVADMLHGVGIPDFH